MTSTAAARLLPASRTLLDTALAAAVLAVSLVLLAHDGPLPLSSSRPGLDPLGVALVAGSAVPLVAWRRFPLAVYAVTMAAGIALAGFGYPADLVLGPAVALYLLAAETPWTVRGIVVVGGLLVAYLGVTSFGQDDFPVVGLAHRATPWAVAWFAGERTRLRRQRLAELTRRAERERLLAVAEERARIARDLHDSAGHAISLIAVRAGAARLRHHEDPDRSLQALQAVEELARHTVAEIDHLVAGLREADHDGTAPPGLASLDTLIAHHEEAGLRVRLDVTGPPRPLGTAADQAAYRILQQALTNAARHGTGAAAVRLAYTGTDVELTVTNPVRANGTPRPGGGHGLIGMRERATLLGGRLDAARSDGAFRVHASIPYGGPAA